MKRKVRQTSGLYCEVKVPEVFALAVALGSRCYALYGPEAKLAEKMPSMEYDE